MNKRTDSPPPMVFVAAWARLADQTLPVLKRSQQKNYSYNKQRQQPGNQVITPVVAKIQPQAGVSKTFTRDLFTDDHTRYCRRESTE